MQSSTPIHGLREVRFKDLMANRHLTWKCTGMVLAYRHFSRNVFSVRWNITWHCQCEMKHYVAQSVWDETLRCTVSVRWNITLHSQCEMKHYVAQSVSGRCSSYSDILRAQSTQRSSPALKRRHTKTTTKTRIAYGNSPGMRVNTRYINSTRGTADIIVLELCESRGGRPGLSVLTSLLVSVDVKIYCTVHRHWSQLVPNMSTDIWGH